MAMLINQRWSTVDADHCGDGLISPMGDGGAAERRW